MINILKPLAAWAIRFKTNEFERATLKLTFYYVLSTAIILFVSSTAILVLFTPSEADISFRLYEDSIKANSSGWGWYELREHLSTVLVFVDVVILIFVSVWSYYLARLTLSPIKEVHERQRHFMSDVAHELRTPLSVLRSGAETMLRHEHQPNDYRDFIKDVQEESERLTRLSNQLLHLLRVGQKKELPKQEQDISKLLSSIVTRFKSYANEYGVSLKANIASGVKAEIEPDQLNQAVQNLLKNAVDYNQSNGTVEITLKETVQEIVIAVADTGVGIPQDKQETIFSRFVKLDSARQQTGRDDDGAGLGLSIVQAVVARHNGAITIESTLGEGTTIAISLPKNHS